MRVRNRGRVLTLGFGCATQKRALGALQHALNELSAHAFCSFYDTRSFILLFTRGDNVWSSPSGCAMEASRPDDVLLLLQQRQRSHPPLSRFPSAAQIYNLPLFIGDANAAQVQSCQQGEMTGMWTLMSCAMVAGRCVSRIQRHLLCRISWYRQDLS